MLTFEFIHFCVLVDHRYKAIYKKEYKRYPGPKSIYKKLRILNFLVLLYLPPKLIFLNLLSIKSIIKNKFYISNRTLKDTPYSKANSKKPKFAFLFGSGFSKQPRDDLFLYDQFKSFGISKSEPIVVFHGLPELFKDQILLNHKPGYIFCLFPKLSLFTLIKIIGYLIKNLFNKKFSFWLLEFFSDDFEKVNKFIKTKIDEFNIRVISVTDSWSAERNIFNYSIKTSKKKIKFITRERSYFCDIHDKWSRDFILTDDYIAIYKRDHQISVRSNRKFYLPYKVNVSNYKKYSALNSKISSCSRKILILTSNFSQNKNPFGQQKIDSFHIDPLLEVLANYLSKNPFLGIVFKCKKVGEYDYLNEWLISKKNISQQIDIKFPSKGIPLLDLTHGYDEFISLTPYCVPSTIYELSGLIPKQNLHFIDFSNIYGSFFYKQTKTGKGLIEKLPFNIHKDINSFLKMLNIKDKNLERKLSIEEYNIYCDKLNKRFLKEINF